MGTIVALGNAWRTHNCGTNNADTFVYVATERYATMGQDASRGLQWSVGHLDVQPG